MKLLCVGYPKTGSKSCSSALRQLGYKVADFVETLEFLSIVWLVMGLDFTYISNILNERNVISNKTIMRVAPPLMMCWRSTPNTDSTVIKIYPVMFSGRICIAHWVPIQK